ncbi:hypothetical protein [Alicyclobacillus fastidiosus]|uniref:UsfY protein n=1 Tax=Alicyclobacillus fastidiosus TaxID=392011 RepID=A0ABV5AGB1_9BACL|nr:hypothetical protein [Alicyclobacillus fastidiosus]WEH08942.1 hypothetical protein PYS47_20005 [Alicyclobacillus fastidiosus]
MQSSRPSYTQRNLNYEYLMFLVGAIFIGFIVAWAQFPHGFTRAATFGSGAAVLLALWATVGFFRRRANLKQYLERRTSQVGPEVSS